MAGPVALLAEMGRGNDGAVPRCEVPIRKGGFLWFYGTHALSLCIVIPLRAVQQGKTGAWDNNSGTVVAAPLPCKPPLAACSMYMSTVHRGVKRPVTSMPWTFPETATMLPQPVAPPPRVM